MSSSQDLTEMELANEECLSSQEIRALVAGIPAERPEARDRDSVATWAAIHHLAISPEISDVYYLPTDAPENEIRLLEVNGLAEQRRDDEVEAVDFGFDVDGLDYRLMVADLSRQEHDGLRFGGLELPDGWVLGGAWHWSRR